MIPHRWCQPQTRSSPNRGRSATTTPLPLRFPGRRRRTGPRKPCPPIHLPAYPPARLSTCHPRQNLRGHQENHPTTALCDQATTQVVDPPLHARLRRRTALRSGSVNPPQIPPLGTEQSPNVGMVPTPTGGAAGRVSSGGHPKRQSVEVHDPAPGQSLACWTRTRYGFGAVAIIGVCNRKGEL
jgi:hypothetical protein